MKLRYIFIGDELCARVREEYDLAVRTLVHDMPDIQIIEIETFVWQIVNQNAGRSGHGLQKLELWSDRRTELLKREWFDWVGCEDALWADIF
jgi:hypothetical protein